MPTLEQRLEDLEARLQQIENEKSILETVYQYDTAVDYHQEPDSYLDCFTDDAVWFTSNLGLWAGKGSVRAEGKAEIRKLWNSLPKRAVPGYLTKHFVSNPEIVIENDRASCRAYFINMREDASGPQIFSIGAYIDKLVLCPDKRWRITERQIARDVVTPAMQDVAPLTKGVEPDRD
jgi:hypothetical protein